MANEPAGAAYRDLEAPRLGGPVVAEGIQEDDDVGVALWMEDVHVQLAPPRRHAPVDAANPVAAFEGANVRELDTVTCGTSHVVAGIHLRFGRSRSLPDPLQTREDLHRTPMVEHGLPYREPPTAHHAHRDETEYVGSPMGGRQREVDTAFDPGIERYHPAPRPPSSLQRSGDLYARSRGQRDRPRRRARPSSRPCPPRGNAPGRPRRRVPVEAAAMRPALPGRRPRADTRRPRTPHRPKSRPAKTRTAGEAESTGTSLGVIPLVIEWERRPRRAAWAPGRGGSRRRPRR